MVDLNDTEKQNLLIMGIEAGLSEYTPEELYERREQFIENCRFAHQLNTARGRALEIDGEVIEIVSSRPAFHVDAISKALRRGGEAAYSNDLQERLNGGRATARMSN